MSLKLYELLPEIIRFRDRQAGSPNSEFGGVLEGVLSPFEMISNDTAEKTRALPHLLNPSYAEPLDSQDLCSPAYFAYLSLTLGTEIAHATDDSEATTVFQRWLIQNLVATNKIKGTHRSVDKRLAYLNDTMQRAFRLVELWKTHPRTISGYSDTYDVDEYNIKSARIRVQEDVDSEWQYLDTDAVNQIAEAISDLLPIHVRLLTQFDETVIGPEDLYSSVEEVESYTGDMRIADNTDAPRELSFVHDRTCLLACEADCQTNYEHWSCALTCEVGCQNPCETSCQHACQISCEASACEAVCEAGGCEEPPCALSCQVFEESAHTSCLSGCQVCSEVENYPVYVTGVDELNQKLYGRVHWPDPDNWPPDPKYHITLTCESACQVACEGTCEAECEAAVEEESGHEIDVDVSGVSKAFVLSRHKLLHTWIMTKLVKPAEFTEQVVQPSTDGDENFFEGIIEEQPHPCSVKFAAEGVPKATGRGRIPISPDAVMLVNEKVDHPDVGLEPGDWVRVWNAKYGRLPELPTVKDSTYYQVDEVYTDHPERVKLIGACLCGCETGCEVGCQGTEVGCEKTCETRTEYAEVFSYAAGVRPDEFPQVAVNTIQVPTGPDNTDVWTGLLQGDIKYGLVNFRPDEEGEYPYELELKKPPHKGSRLLVRYHPEADCRYVLSVVHPDSRVVTVKNISSSPRSRFDIMTIHGVRFTPTENLNQFLDNPGFELDDPTEDTLTSFVVLQDDLAIGATGNGALWGITGVKVYMNEEDHKYANPEAANTAYLQSAESGLARILWREDSSAGNPRWAVVLLPSNPGGSGVPGTPFALTFGEITEVINPVPPFQYVCKKIVPIADGGFADASPEVIFEPCFNIGDMSHPGAGKVPVGRPVIVWKDPSREQYFIDVINYRGVYP